MDTRMLTTFNNLKIYLQTLPVLVTPMACDTLEIYVNITKFSISGILFKEVEEWKSQSTMSVNIATCKDWISSNRKIGLHPRYNGKKVLTLLSSS